MTACKDPEVGNQIICEDSGIYVHGEVTDLIHDAEGGLAAVVGRQEDGKWFCIDWRAVRPILGRQ